MLIILNSDSEQNYLPVTGGATDAHTAATPGIWRVRLLGTLEVTQEGHRIARFRAQRYGILLAYLALRPRQKHGRDELIELLWPDADQDTGRARLRQALTSLRRQLESHNGGAPPGSVLVTSAV